MIKTLDIILSSNCLSFPVSIPYSFTDVAFNFQILVLKSLPEGQLQSKDIIQPIFTEHFLSSECCCRSCCIPEKQYKVNGLYCHFGRGDRFIMLEVN